MNRKQAERAMADGARVVAEAGDDTDYGVIHELRDEPARTMASVGWESLQVSEIDIEALELAEGSK